MLLVQERLAELGAGAAVERERGRPAAERRLFPEVDLDATGPAEAGAAERQVAHLAWGILGERWSADGEHAADLARVTALYRALAGSSEAVAWRVVLTVYLRDPALGVI